MPREVRLSDFSNGGSVTFTYETNYPQRYWIGSPYIYSNRNEMNIPRGGSYERNYTGDILTSVTITGGNEEYPTTGGASKWTFALRLNLISPTTGQEIYAASQTVILTPSPWSDWLETIPTPTP